MRGSAVPELHWLLRFDIWQVRRRAHAKVETPDASIEVADIAHRDVARVRWTGRHGVGLQCVLDLRTVVRRDTAVGVLTDVIVADRRAVVYRAALDVLRVERRERRGIRQRV